ncbi:MAG TPA: DUF5329 family protein [Xanthomonadales bacterium]|nr:DUF5329 family protein [Xanthomonadales bacterium]
MRGRMRWPARLAVCAALAAAPAAAGVPPTAAREIDALRATLGTSSCAFERNGKWYSAVRALEHVDRKYAVLKRRGLIDSAEDFITYAASKSSVTGRPYRVRCGAADARLAADWFAAELARLRGQLAGGR